MNINIIKKYIDILSKKDIDNFLKLNSIFINETELDFLYKTMKNDYKRIIDNDENIIEEIKNNINEDAFNKLLSLYKKYKK